MLRNDPCWLNRLFSGNRIQYVVCGRFLKGSALERVEAGQQTVLRQLRIHFLCVLFEDIGIDAITLQPNIWLFEILFFFLNVKGHMPV